MFSSNIWNYTVMVEIFFNSKTYLCLFTKYYIIYFYTLLWFKLNVYFKGGLLNDVIWLKTVLSIMQISIHNSNTVLNLSYW
jgi:hypothetical protein